MKQDLHKLNPQQWKETLENYQKELSKLYMQRASGAKLQNPGNVKKIRRNIARIYTFKKMKPAQPKQHTQKTTAEKQGGARNKT